MDALRREDFVSQVKTIPEGYPRIQPYLNYQAVAARARSVREPVGPFRGARSAGVEDSFRFPGYLATHVKDVSAEEMQAAMAEQTPA